MVTVHEHNKGPSHCITFCLASASPCTMQDGYEVVVDEYDPDKRARAEQEAKEANVAEHAARAAGQLKQGDMLIGEFARSIGLPGAAPAGV